MVRFKEAEYNAFSCSGQNRPQMDASERAGPRQGSFAGMALCQLPCSALYIYYLI